MRDRVKASQTCIPARLIAIGAGGNLNFRGGVNGVNDSVERTVNDGVKKGVEQRGRRVAGYAFSRPPTPYFTPLFTASSRCFSRCYQRAFARAI
jgi:hypothetical protein